MRPLSVALLIVLLAISGCDDSAQTMPADESPSTTASESVEDAPTVTMPDELVAALAQAEEFVASVTLANVAADVDLTSKGRSTAGAMP